MKKRIILPLIILSIFSFCATACELNSDDINEAAAAVSSMDVDAAAEALSNVDPSDIGISEETVAEVVNAVDTLNNLINSGYCWIACCDDEALVLYINGDQSSIKTVSTEGVVTDQDITGKWSLSDSHFSIYNDIAKEPTAFEWEAYSEEEVSSITLRCNESLATYYQTQVSDLDKAIELAKSYIVNKADAEEVAESEDITEVLDGFKGVSIVDAFFYAGLEPSYKNRAIFAKKAGIDKYTGTAAQNLELLQYMGGILK